jgi:phosphoribosylaminoimidazole-succinocarboxamide synthase
VPNHLITADVSEFPAALQPYADQLEGRSMLVKRAKMFPVECVARGYLAGSGWKEYKAAGTVCGIPLPGGLLDGSRLPEPMFTPAPPRARTARTTKTFPLQATEAIAGRGDAAELRRLTLELYGRARRTRRGLRLILADTKFEFGKTAEGIILADEVLTPDSSRFWEARPGSRAARRHRSTSSSCAIILKSIHWNKQAPAPGCPTRWSSGRRPSILKRFAA